MTLVEIVVALTIFAFAAPGMLYGIMAGIRLTYSASQHASAFNLCLDLFEQMRGVSDYNYLTASNFPPNTLRMTHLGGSKRVALNCRRSCSIANRDSPARKDVEIYVTWVYLGKSMQETLNATIYRRQ